MTEETKSKLCEIKQSFRLMMNGVAAQSMRRKGLNYKLNWGVSLPDLQRMAADYGKDRALAEALWKEDIRECKILAAMTMPTEQMDKEAADRWMKEMPTGEIVETTIHYLFRHLSCARELAAAWRRSADELTRAGGLMLTARLLKGDVSPDEKELESLKQECTETFENARSAFLKRAAGNCLMQCETSAATVS